MRILVLGASGMIGSAAIRVLAEKTGWEVFGTVRSESLKHFFLPHISERIVAGIDVNDHDCLIDIMGRIRPDVTVNCVGLTKHKAAGNEPLAAIPLNSLLPHRLASLCAIAGARLIHVSTDCVFSGEKGNYTEIDPPDATDIYAKSKSLGEVLYPHTITLRTSTIGHELQSAHGLLDWFLSQQQCKGFSRAIFSGLPSVVFAQIIRDVVIPRSDLFGLYHVAAEGAHSRPALLHPGSGQRCLCASPASLVCCIAWHPTADSRRTSGRDPDGRVACGLKERGNLVLRSCRFGGCAAQRHSSPGLESPLSPGSLRNALTAAKVRFFGQFDNCVFRGETVI